MKNTGLNNTEKLTADIVKRIRKHNIPAIFICADIEKKRTGVVMDNRNEVKDLNISLLLDAMINGEQTGALLNVVLHAACGIIANSTQLEELFMQNLAELKRRNVAADAGIDITQNTAQA